jgi:hypothetical protein
VFEETFVAPLLNYAVPCSKLGVERMPVGEDLDVHEEFAEAVA